MRHIEFRRLFDNDNALRVHFDVEHGEVLVFVVQLECLFSGKWTPVIRYDTAHGFAHRDKMCTDDLTILPNYPPIFPNSPPIFPGSQAMLSGSRGMF